MVFDNVGKLKNDGSPTAFAEFLKRLANGKVGGVEWQRFAVTHYGDALLEDARRSIVRLASNRNGGVQWSDTEVAIMQYWSRRLRSALDGEG